MLSSTLSYATCKWLIEACNERDIPIRLRHWFLERHDTILIHATWCSLIHLVLSHFSNMFLMHMLHNINWLTCWQSHRLDDYCMTLLSDTSTTTLFLLLLWFTLIQITLL